MQAILLVLTTILVAVGPITYAVSIIKGRTKPHRMTRFILAFVLTLNFASILAAKGNLGAEIFAGVSCLQALVILGMSVWRGMGGTSKFDWICLGIAIVGIVGWKITGDPIIGVWYYVFAGLAAFLSLIAYKIEPSSIFQIYILVCVFIMIGLIYRKELMKSFS